MIDSRKAWPLILVLIGAIAVRAVLLAFDVVPFDGDEAIVALMARHIRQGERPWFFYGQRYMGSLDAYLVAGAFAVLGESVLAMRVVQVGLFVAVMLTGYGVALGITADRRAALLTVALLAFPPVLLTLYTTVSLGGYGEVLLTGNLLLLLGHRLGRGDTKYGGIWLAWGLVAGLGFWVLGLVMVYVVPVALWVLWRLRARPWRGYLLAALGFAIGSLPWWLGQGYVEVVGLLDAAGSFPGSVGARALNFVALGLPALFGLRFPWSFGGPPLWLAVPALALYLGALGYGLRRSDEGTARSGRLLLWGVCGVLVLGFVLTPYGGDPSGRYFLPMYLPLFIFTADALVALWERVGRWAWGLLGVVLVFNLVSTGQAALTYPPGISAHFNPIAQVDHRYDSELIDFLRTHDGTRGYANYWVSYPIAFLSGEEIVLVPRLPYKISLCYSSHDDRYVPYGEWVGASSTVVYVTTDLPALNGLLREQFAALGVDFHEVQIGSYHVFYDLSRKVTPGELDIPVE